MGIIIRSIELEDGLNIQKVARESWHYTYGNIFSKSFIDNFVDRAYNPEAMPAYLKQIGSGTGGFYVAVDNNQLIGFAQIGVDWDFKGEFRLSRIYLLPKYLGKGIGKALLEKCESFLLSINHTKYGLYVHKDNKIGRKFYTKNGFVNFPDRDDDDELYLIKHL